MKRVMVMLMAVFLCSLSAWCSSSMIVALGTEVIENNSFDSAEESFRKRGMPLEKFPSGNYGYMCEGPKLLAVLDLTSSSKIKKVSFFCGAAMWWGIDHALDKAGYKLIRDEKTTLPIGVTVPQKTFANGTIICLVQTLDNDIKQVIFKRKATKSKSKRGK